MSRYNSYLDILSGIWDIRDMRTVAPEAKDVKAIHMLLERSLVKEIEDYRHLHQYSTRVEAMKALLRYGLVWVSTNKRKIDKRGL